MGVVMDAPVKWTVEVKDRFAAAHKLEHHRGQCRRLHGHTYEVAVMVIRKDGGLDDINMVVDLGPLRRALRRTLVPLDHSGKLLNELLHTADPTCEIVARHVAEVMAVEMSSVTSTTGLEILRVTVSESIGATVCYYPGGLT